MDCSTILRNKASLFVLALWILSFHATSALCEDYQQVAGLIDVRTTFSDGAHNLEFLIQLAKERGFKVIFVNDHDRMVMEYGLFPFRNIIKKRVEKPSVNKMGAARYLSAIKDVNLKYPDMLVIPGVESAPFYYWTGSPFKEGLTAHNWERHILIMGLENAEDYANLPILHNGFSTAYTADRILIALLFILVAVIGLFVFRWEKTYRIFGVLLFVFGIAFAVDVDPFSSSPYDPYHGDQGIAPYQRLIDYVNERGGITYWNHPETRSGVGAKSPIHVNTPPYPEVLEGARRYTGFAALYGDRITVTEPGREWDRVLQEYCVGERLRPVWGISAADYHREGGAGEKLGNFPTVFLVKQFTRDAILSALNNGKMYAVRGPYNKRGVLAEFSITDTITGNKGACGDEVCVRGPAAVRITVLASDNGAHKIKVRLIRGGVLVKTFNGTTPLTIDFKDDYFERGKKIYYRVDVSGDAGSILSNPIFVLFSS